MKLFNYNSEFNHITIDFYKFLYAIFIIMQ